MPRPSPQTLAILAAATAWTLLAGCQNSSSNRLTLKRSAGSGGSPIDQKAGKPTPPLAGGDRLSMMLNELNRTERALRNTVREPQVPRPSCATFVSTSSKRGLFLTANFKDCRWAQSLSGEKTKFIYRFDGTETYDRKAGKTLITSKLGLQIGREGSGKIVSRPELRAVWSVAGEDLAKPRTVTFKEVFGNESVATTDYWVAQISEGEFAPVSGDQRFKMLAGTSLEFGYRPAAAARAKKASPIVTAALDANTDIEFASDCPWPQSGTLTFRETDRDGAVQTSTVTLSDTGYRVGAGTEVAWPHGHCLGQP